MSEDNPKIIRRFALGIECMQEKNNNIVSKLQTENSGVPIETIILLLKAYANKLEKDYYSNLDKYWMQK